MGQVRPAQGVVSLEDASETAPHSEMVTNGSGEPRRRSCGSPWPTRLCRSRRGAGGVDVVAALTEIIQRRVSHIAAARRTGGNLAGGGGVRVILRLMSGPRFGDASAYLEHVDALSKQLLAAEDPYETGWQLWSDSLGGRSTEREQVHRSSGPPPGMQTLGADPGMAEEAAATIAVLTRVPLRSPLPTPGLGQKDDQGADRSP
jgi:hypothetical protein